MFGEIAPKINKNITYNTSYIPTIGDGTNNFTTSAPSGTYCQIGNMVFFQSSLIWTSVGSASGQLRYSLPFTIGPSVFRVSCTVGSVTGITITGSYLVVNGSSGANFVTFQGISTVGTGTTVNCSACATVGSVQLSGHYWTN